MVKTCLVIRLVLASCWGNYYYYLLALLLRRKEQRLLAWTAVRLGQSHSSGAGSQREGPGSTLGADHSFLGGLGGHWPSPGGWDVWPFRNTESRWSRPPYRSSPGVSALWDQVSSPEH